MEATLSTFQEALGLNKDQRDNNIKQAGVLTMHVPESFIGGSVLIDPYKAMDIDVCVPEWQHESLRNKAYKFGLNEYDPNEGEYADDAINNEIVALYRGNNEINVIVVSSLYWPAYVVGMMEYKRDPSKYTDKSVRASLHIEMRAVIRTMLDGSWANKFHTPVVAVNQQGWSYTE